MSLSDCEKCWDTPCTCAGSPGALATVARAFGFDSKDGSSNALGAKQLHIALWDRWAQSILDAYTEKYDITWAAIPVPGSAVGQWIMRSVLLLDDRSAPSPHGARIDLATRLWRSDPSLGGPPTNLPCDAPTSEAPGVEEPPHDDD